MALKPTKQEAYNANSLTYRAGKWWATIQSNNHAINRLSTMIYIYSDTNTLEWDLFQRLLQNTRPLKDGVPG
jgi:hypothetical protein